VGATAIKKLKKAGADTTNVQKTPETSFRCLGCAAAPIEIQGGDGKVYRHYSGNMHKECFEHHPRHMYQNCSVDPNFGKL
jgi:hypothetical protein